MGNVSGGNVSIKIHTLSQQDWYLKNCVVSCGNVVINRQYIYQCNESISFNDVYGYIENGDVSGGYDCMNIHTIYQQNGLS